MVITDSSYPKDSCPEIIGCGAVIKTDPPKKSLHEQFLESKGIKSYTDEHLYFSFKTEHGEDGIDFVILSFYIQPEQRMNIRPHFQKVFEVLKKDCPDCKYMVATVIPKIKGSENMLRCLLKMGFMLDGAENGIITLRYLVPEKEHDKYK